MKPTVIILTYNSERTISATLSQASLLSDEIFVVDSFSTDGTQELSRNYGATVVQHAFENYGAQRNWAIENLPFSGTWQLHLDADEWLDSELVSAIIELPDEPVLSGYFLPRYVRFLGRVIRHGGMSPTWHLRLFRNGCGRCENRKYDQHFLLVKGDSGRLKGSMIDDIRMPLSEWTARHNRWSDGEIEELKSGESKGRLKPNLFGNPTEQKRYLRCAYDRVPLFIRAFGLFIYRYIVRLGFLDGIEGFIFWVLQTFWFRFLVDAKIWEYRHACRPEKPLK
jgi:glycosyltransferase involved in cell wall biosynthesis